MKKGIHLVLITLLFFFTSTAAFSQNQNSFQKGEAAMKKGNYQEAIELFTIYRNSQKGHPIEMTKANNKIVECEKLKALKEREKEERERSQREQAQREQTQREQALREQEQREQEQQLYGLGETAMRGERYREAINYFTRLKSETKEGRTIQLCDQKIAECMEIAKPKSGYDNGHEWVDLGLSVKWVTCNVGASSPSDYGNYYAWGETSTKGTYDWSTYKWCNGSYDSQTKYNTDSNYGSVDNRTRLSLFDDAAEPIGAGTGVCQPRKSLKS